MGFNINDFLNNYLVISIMIALIIDVIMAKLMENVAIMKGYGKSRHIFAICFFLTILGYLYVLALPDKVIQSQNQQIIEILKRQKEEQ